MLKIVAEVFSEGAAADWNSTAEEDKKIHPGDLLVEVNGERVAGLDMHTLSTMVPGPVGTPVILRLRSVKENKEFEVSVTFAHACSVHTSHVLRDCEAANVPGWQERWKGETAGGLLLMRKRLGSPLEQAADALQLRPSAPPPAPGFSELNVTIGQVAAYGDPDAWVWFGFLLARNARYLGPAYGAAGAVAGLLTYAAILVAARGPLGVGW